MGAQPARLLGRKRWCAAPLIVPGLLLISAPPAPAAQTAPSSRTIASTITIQHGPQGGGPTGTSTCNVELAVDAVSDAVHAVISMACDDRAIHRIYQYAGGRPEGGTEQTIVFTPQPPTDDTSPGPLTLREEGTAAMDATRGVDVSAVWSSLYDDLAWVYGVASSNPELACTIANAPEGFSGTHAADCELQTYVVAGAAQPAPAPPAAPSDPAVQQPAQEPAAAPPPNQIATAEPTDGVVAEVEAEEVVAEDPTDAPVSETTGDNATDGADPSDEALDDGSNVALTSTEGDSILLPIAGLLLAGALAGTGVMLFKKKDPALVVDGDELLDDDVPVPIHPTMNISEGAGCDWAAYWVNPDGSKIPVRLPSIDRRECCTYEFRIYTDAEYRIATALERERIYIPIDFELPGPLRVRTVSLRHAADIGGNGAGALLRAEAAFEIGREQSLMREGNVTTRTHYGPRGGRYERMRLSDAGRQALADLGLKRPYPSIRWETAFAQTVEQTVIEVNYRPSETCRTCHGEHLFKAHSHSSVTTEWSTSCPDHNITCGNSFQGGSIAHVWLNGESGLLDRVELGTGHTEKLQLASARLNIAIAGLTAAMKGKSDGAVYAEGVGGVGITFEPPDDHQTNTSSHLPQGGSEGRTTARRARIIAHNNLSIGLDVEHHRNPYTINPMRASNQVRIDHLINLAGSVDGPRNPAAKCCGSGACACNPSFKLRVGQRAPSERDVQADERRGGSSPEYLADAALEIDGFTWLLRRPAIGERIDRPLVGEPAARYQWTLGDGRGHDMNAETAADRLRARQLYLDGFRPL